MFSLGAYPLRAVDAETQDKQSHYVLDGFIEKAKLGGATTDAFLRMDDVKGSATDSAHKDQISVLFARNYIAGVLATGATLPHPTRSLYYLVIPTDKSYPILQQAAASNKPFQKAEIFFRQAIHGEQKEYSVDTLEDVRVVYFLRTSTPIIAYPDVVIIGLSFNKATWTQSSTKAGRDFAGSKNL